MRSIVMQSDGHLRSDLIPIGSTHSLAVGDTLQAERLLEVSDDIVIEIGEQGTVVEVDAATGAVELLMDLFHRGLRDWDNHLLLMPFDTDDILSGLKIVALLMGAAALDMNTLTFEVIGADYFGMIALELA